MIDWVTESIEFPKREMFNYLIKNKDLFIISAVMEERWDFMVNNSLNETKNLITFENIIIACEVVSNLLDGFEIDEDFIILTIYPTIYKIFLKIEEKIELENICKNVIEILVDFLEYYPKEIYNHKVNPKYEGRYDIEAATVSSFCDNFILKY